MKIRFDTVYGYSEETEDCSSMKQLLNGGLSDNDVGISFKDAHGQHFFLNYDGIASITKITKNPKIRIYTVDGNWQETRDFGSTEKAINDAFSDNKAWEYTLGLSFKNVLGSHVFIPSDKITAITEIKEGKNEEN